MKEWLRSVRAKRFAALHAAQSGCRFRVGKALMRYDRTNIGVDMPPWPGSMQFLNPCSFCEGLLPIYRIERGYIYRRMHCCRIGYLSGHSAQGPSPRSLTPGAAKGLQGVRTSIPGLLPKTRRNSGKGRNLALKSIYRLLRVATLRFKIHVLVNNSHNYIELMPGMSSL